jgi:Lrp/AsnC ligand binding domain
MVESRDADFDFKKKLGNSSSINSYGVFGTYDGVLKVNHGEHPSLKEIVDRVRALPSLQRTITFIAETPLSKEPPIGSSQRAHSFTLVNVLLGKEEEVQRAFHRIPGVISSDVVYSEYDLIIEAVADSNEGLASILTQGRKNGNVRKMNTMVVFA